MDRQAQWRRILNLLKQNGHTTARELMIDCGIGSPRKRISELKTSPMLAAEGYEIIDTWEDGYNRYGDPVRYKRYILKEVRQ